MQKNPDNKFDPDILILIVSLVGFGYLIGASVWA